jgi:hypothetical protein
MDRKTPIKSKRKLDFDRKPILLKPKAAAACPNAEAIMLLG